MIYLALFLCLTGITPMTETRNIYIINSTPRVSSDATVITCLDVDGDLLPSDLTLGRVGKGFNGERDIPLPPVSDSNSIVATWDDTFSSSRYGAFYCSGSDGNGTVTTLKTARDAKLNPTADTMTVSIGDQVVIEMTFRRRDLGEVTWKKDGVVLPKDTTSTHGTSKIYTIMSASTSDAGIYYAHFDEHPYLGGFTRVIVRECPAGFWGPPDCSESCLDCMHGGICDTITGMCICPPGFMGNLCEKACGSNVYGPECNHSCQADSCRSMQFCLPDPYGCSCATGWAGSTCEVECPDGLYGANCNESCECQNGGSCERHVGCICPDEWTGIHCHRPKFFFNSSTTRVTLADATQITVECGCAPEVEDCPLQDIQIEITNPDPVPPNINRIIDDSDQSSIRWHLTPFGIDGNWDFACSIDYRGNTYTHNLTVTAIGGPFPEIQTFHNLEANRDTTQSMECRVVTTAGEDVKLRNEQGDLIPLSRHVSIGKSSYYFFHIDALDENEGVYTCVATSQSGQTERDAIFNVLDPPVPERAPSIITNINGNVNLRLNTIPFVGDGPLEEIFVEYKLSTSQTWSTTGSLNPSTTTYLLENLNGETQYEVRVVLVRPGERDEGRGEPGPVFTFQTLCSAPSRSVTLQDVSTDGLDSTSLRLEWKNPVGQDFDRINIYYRTVDRVVFEVVEVNDVSATSYVLRGLQQYQIYKVQVKLMKCGYVGPASNVLQRRTKEGAPGPVRELHVHPVSYASVSIIWQRPQNENGNIRYYNISAARAQPGTNLSDVVVQRADHNEISYLMTNLKAATDYVISISAVTILTGPVVTQEVTTKEWVPFAAPTNIRTESSETTLSFTFDAIIESERNGVIEMYEAKLQDPTVTSSAVPPITQNFTQMSVMFDKLTPGRQYTFNVRGWTAVGPGVWSADALSSTMPGGYDGTSGGSPDKDQSDGGNESSTGINLMIVLLVVISCTACFVAALVISVLCARAVSKRRSRAREAEMNNAEEPVMRMSELITQQSLPNEYDNTAASGYLSRPTSPVLSNQELNYWKIPWEAMFLERNIIAEGNFGQVLKATIKRDGEAIEAAVKILKGGCSDADRKDFIGEVEIMCKVGNHPNIVNLIGACESKGELFVALEFAVHGNLLTLLRKSQCLDVDSTYTNQSLSKMEAEPLSNIQLVNFARDVSLGMKHLSDRSIVHRDLAARNILVCDNMVCKVADFGLSRSDEVYVKMTAGRLPVRWMAIESLNYNVYTSKSDVWSFGILLWEIVTYGGTPYPGLSSAELYEKLPLGYRMDKPLGCDDEMYNIMRHCWRDRPHDRPTFEQLFIALSKMAKSDQNYENQSGVKGAEGGAPPNFSTTTEFKFPSISSDEEIKPGASAV